MNKQYNQPEAGIIHIPVVLIVLFVGVIAFTAGVAYRIQSNRQTAQVVSTEGDDLREIKEVDIEDIIAVLPEQRKDTEDEEEAEIKVEPTKPEPKPEAVDKPKEDKKQKEKTDPTIVKIKSITVESSNGNFVLKAQLPSSYSGTCQALLKPAEGGTHDDHKVAKQSFSGNSCTITVKKLSLNSQYSEWRTYMSFYSNDKTAKSHWTQADNVSL